MAKAKIKKEKSVGSVAAENDQLLVRSFVDLGYASTLMNTSEARFLILGRTGVGKTALLEKIKSSTEHVSMLDPEELSMQYLHSSTILKIILGWGINLEMFYKFLWRHVCILELIRMRYGEVTDVPSTIDRIFDVTNLINRGGKKTKETSHDYLKKYAGDYWVKTDTRIKTLANELSTRLSEDDAIGAQLKLAGFTAGVSSQSIGARESTTKINYEVKDRVQNIVSDYLIADLNRVIELLAEYGFNDPQKRYYLLIDNLDKDWMPDDDLYLDLIRSLIGSVNDVNHKLAGVKILVALRDNIFFRVYKKTTKHEPQREKLADVTLNVKWTKPDLIELINKRLETVYAEARADSQHPPPTFADILPLKKKKYSQDPQQYIIDRTFMRPRDIIDFVNVYLDLVSRASGKPTWTSLFQAELMYSKGRLDSIHDEWKDSYFGLPALYKVLGKMGVSFRASDISQDDIDAVLSNELCENCSWLKSLQEGYLTDRATYDDIRKEFVQAGFITGLLGVKAPDNESVLYSYQLSSFSLSRQTEEGFFLNSDLYVHKAFWKVLGIHGVEPLRDA